MDEDEIQELLGKGKSAARAGEIDNARKILHHVIEVKPDCVDAWLWLAAISESPQLSIEYLNRVLAIEPSNTRAQEGLEWAKARLASTSPIEPTPGEEMGKMSFHPSISRAESPGFAYPAPTKPSQLASGKSDVDKGNIVARPTYDVKPQDYTGEDLRTMLSRGGRLSDSTGFPSDELDWDIIIGETKPGEKGDNVDVDRSTSPGTTNGEIDEEHKGDALIPESEETSLPLGFTPNSDENDGLSK